MSSNILLEKVPFAILIPHSNEAGNVPMKWILLLLTAVSCTKCPDKVAPFTWETIPGREETVGIIRPVYRAKVARDWVKLETPKSLTDTKVANATFVIDNGVKLTVHTFPSVHIPPRAQVDRWKEQLAFSTLKSYGHDGFSGLFLEGEKEGVKTLAWTLQVDPELIGRLNFVAQTTAEKLYYEQMGADFTIKVSGPTELIEEHRSNLLLFANSIELIEEIP